MLDVVPAGWVDTHVHLNYPDFAEDLPEVAQRWREAGIHRLVHSCVTPEEFPQLQAIADQYPEVFLSVGLHPLEARQWQPDMAAQIAQLAAADPRVVAIGETGLDFYKSDPADIELQKQAFQAQIAIAQSQDLALIIHCRDAAEATHQMLSQAIAEAGPVRAVMHCWSGSPAETREFVALGCFVSFSGIVTFKNAQLVRDSALEVPLSQLLIETDCPFLAPTPFRGKRNEPAYVERVAHTLADLLHISPEQLAEQTSQNAAQLFRLPILA
ncbi:TatD family hydrolase [Thermostichus vulcanus]|uniref:D-aminoacyl-tRNA deacylase n=1 Tax=Thermostichus vulcanus str. 'Rupite' TaxID=2813851 RepID=A0ABT0CA45_THEVL|nr:TatD family hydrolase [Thermostichus vulcanus str. 'Rupite']